MNHEQLKATGLFLFLFVVLSVPTASFAAVYKFPATPGAGKTGAGGTYSAPAGSYTASGGGSYASTGVVNINGKPVSVPTKMTLKAGIGPLLKNAMRLNPWTLAGTLAAGWLLDQGFEWLNDEWQKSVPGQHFYYSTSPIICGTGSAPITTEAMVACFTTKWPTITWTVRDHPTTLDFAFMDANGSYYSNLNRKSNGAATTSTPTDADWEALPDPTPVVEPELPSAPYSNHPAFTEGLIYQNPGIGFNNAIIEPMGAPYEKIDGSTVQPIVKITPAPDGEQVRIESGEVPLTTPDGAPILDAQGQPVTVTSGQPKETPDPAPEPAKSACQINPEALGCATLGSVADTTLTTEVKSIASITPISVGGAGSCPAPLTTMFMGTPITLSYDLPCQAASMLKPLILTLAWLSAGVIFIGGVRQ